MAHSSSHGHVGYIVWLWIASPCKILGMPSQRFFCPEVAISQRIHLWEGRTGSNQPCESSNALPDRCEQDFWVLVALWERTRFVTAGTFLEHVCPAVGCPGRHSRRSGTHWCRRSISERRNWTLHLGHRAVQRCWLLSSSPGSHRQEMFCCNPS